MEMTTAYMVAERRLMDAFAAEMEALGLKAHTNGISGSYREDGVFVAQFQTEPEPVKGNKAKMEALRAAGYTVEVYAPYNWNRRRASMASIFSMKAGPAQPQSRADCWCMRAASASLSKGPP